MSTTHKVPESICPSCKVPLNAATLEGMRFPVEGDISICIFCEQVLCFDEDLKLQLLHDEQQEMLPTEVQDAITRMCQQVRRIKAHAGIGRN